MTVAFRSTATFATPTAAQARGRYSALAAGLHWLIAVLILFQVGFAWWVMGRTAIHSPTHAWAMSIHTSTGITVLVLSVIRLAARLAWPPPPLPATLAPWDQFLAQASHGLFYFLIIALPLTGWAIASLRPRPIAFWGLFAWPHLPGLAGAGRQIGHLLATTHTLILLWITLILLVLHVAGAIRNQFGPSPVFWRMVPFGSPRPGGPARR